MCVCVCWGGGCHGGLLLYFMVFMSMRCVVCMHDLKRLAILWWLVVLRFVIHSTLI